MNALPCVYGNRVSPVGSENDVSGGGNLSNPDVTDFPKTRRASTKPTKPAATSWANVLVTLTLSMSEPRDTKNPQMNAATTSYM